MTLEEQNNILSGLVGGVTVFEHTFSDKKKTYLVMYLEEFNTIVFPPDGLDIDELINFSIAQKRIERRE